MSKICFLVLIGLPAVGKTSFCRWLLDKYPQHFQILHFCYDNFFEISHLQNQTIETDATYKSQRHQILNNLKSIIQALKDKIEIPSEINNKITTSNNTKADILILLDDNHYYRSMRYKLYQLCKSNGLGFGQLYFSCDLDTALCRNSSRDLVSRLPIHIITQMAERLEIPNLNNQWEALTLTIKNEEIHMQWNLILDFIFKAFENVLKNDADTSTECKQQQTTLLHNLDIILRKRITELLKIESDKVMKSVKAAQLNTRRREILEKLRKHSVQLDDTQLNKFVGFMNGNKNIVI